jgi:hypothetical protein
MAKRKNKDAAKRRDTKKVRKAINRKAQARVTNLHNIRPEYTTEHLFDSKLSKVILDYAKPLTDALDGTEVEERAIIVSVMFWNASLFSKEKALETIEPVLSELANGDQLLEEEFDAMFEMMYKRKQSLFSDDKRFVVDYQLEENNEGFILQVASTTIQA